MKRVPGLDEILTESALGAHPAVVGMIVAHLTQHPETMDPDEGSAQAGDEPGDASEGDDDPLRSELRHAPMRLGTPTRWCGRCLSVEDDEEAATTDVQSVAGLDPANDDGVLEAGRAFDP